MSVRIVWNADSTFDASSADVSINDSPFSAAIRHVCQLTSLEGEARTERTREGFRFLSRHSTKVLEIALVTDQHDNNVRVCVVTQLLEPARDVNVRSVLGDVVNE